MFTYRTLVLLSAQWVFLGGSQSGKAAAVTLCAIFRAVYYKQRLHVCYYYYLPFSQIL